MIYKFEEFLLEYVNRDFKSEKIEDFADLYIDRIAEKLKVRLIKKLGKGYYGIAYLADKNRVIKITTDVSESENAKKMIGERNKHFVNYYDVFEMTLNNMEYKDREEFQVFFILMDYVRTLTEKEKKEWANGGTNHSFFNYKRSDEDIEGIIDRLIENDDEYFINKDLIKQRKGMFEEAEKYGIKFDDAHSDNLGISKDGNIVYFDIGSSERVLGEYKEIKKRDFENDFIKINKLIKSKYEPEEPIKINDLVVDVAKLLNINKVKAWKYIRDEVYYQFETKNRSMWFEYLLDSGIRKTSNLPNRIKKKGVVIKYKKSGL